jgi:hypothetical protein
MADVIKGGARKPRVLGGSCYTGESYSADAPHMRYNITVSGNTAYSIQLTEAEMLRTIEEWLRRFNTHQRMRDRVLPNAS